MFNKNQHYFSLAMLLILSFCLYCCSDDNSVNTESEPITQDPTENEEEPEIEPLSDEELLNTVQRQTLKYFWDFAEPSSQMARERYHPNQTNNSIVTTGGSGFGLMAIIVGIERGFITKTEALQRLNNIANFLENADRFHGAWPHWLNGQSGNVEPFSNTDNGGDLVETSFLAQGIIVVREYLKNGTSEEQIIAEKFNQLWQGIDWQWYTNNQNVLYWHWSPNYEWQMNMPLEGYNECLITYVLAASSPDHAIDSQVYHQGWARNGNITTINLAYGFPLIVKHNGNEQYGGPLFWAHYSYLGLDPRNLSDQYANYWQLNQNHTLINYNYCVENPNNYSGYGENFWGLTASYTRNQDGSVGYTAHSPANDTGVISPTAAVSSIVYTPEESLAMMHNLYEKHHELSWGSAGFYDAISLTGNDWAAKQYLAIDQGPMIVMIENYRTGLIWDLFMQAPEIQNGLDNLNFNY
ncbi:glucoamylase family protein [Mesonia aestuariivivens]|uniref:Beta-glucosidase n=1 Tax=Mesonia aestuariivivens TaxID=2796128 RepID=A0ABS6W2A4_9FLAO|nr:glucoamylase family protein [Mesonia aestuariivivens]MBW2961981.1 beta-glucosidase [Mesonia aestuariivivens]